MAASGGRRLDCGGGQGNGGGNGCNGGNGVVELMTLATVEVMVTATATAAAMAVLREMVLVMRRRWW